MIYNGLGERDDAFACSGRQAAKLKSQNARRVSRRIGLPFFEAIGYNKVVRNGSRKPVTILHRRLEKSLLALQSAIDGDAFIKAVFRLLKSSTPCDFVNVCLRMVRKDAGTIVYQMIDSRGREFGLDLLENVFFREHPAMPTLMANPGIKFINTREVLAPEAELHKTRFYREVMQVMGFRHAIGMFFWENPPQTPEAIFSLLRGEGQLDFNDAEVAVLARLHPHIDAALRRIRTIEKERAARDELRGLVRQASRPACVLDWELGVAGASRTARESCARWNLGAASAPLKPPAFRLPPPLRAACAELKAQWSASLRTNPVSGAVERRCVQHPTRPLLRATVSMHPHRLNPFAKPGFLIEFMDEKGAETVSRGDRRALLSSLNPRQRALIRFVCEGRSNQEIADLTGRAVGTVKNSLHTLFRKLRVPSRGMLVAFVHGNPELRARSRS